MTNQNSLSVWEFFDKNGETGLAVCNKCTRSLTSSRISNLRRHLIQVHQIELGEIEKKCKHVKVSITKEKLLRSFIGLVTEDSLPFNVLDSPNMRNILDPICEGLRKDLGQKICLNGRNCKQYVKIVADDIRANIKKELSGKLFSLKIDSASRLCRNIFGISAQFIKQDVIESRILAMVELKGAHSSTAKNLASEILSTLNKYEVNLIQIVSITSDNGANMIKSTKILSQLCGDSEKDDNNDSLYANSDYLDNLDIYQNEIIDKVDNIEICRCAAHTAQLCALDVTKNFEVKKYILNCRNLVKFIRKSSNGYRELLEIRKLRIPQLDCPTRWGSTYTMVSDLLGARNVLETISSMQSKSDEENFVISEAIWEFMESYICICKSLHKAITKFQEEQLHYGDFYAHWLKCKLCTESILAENNASEISLIYKIGSALLKSFEKRTAKLLTNEIFNACLFLDPRFQHILTANKKNEAITYLKMLWDRSKRISSNTNSSQNTCIAEPTENMEEEDKMLYNFLTAYTTPIDANVADAYAKIERLHLPFQRNDMNVLDFWKEKKNEMPELYLLSTICFAVPPTQVTIERAFSSLKLILTDNRNRLSQETLENVLLVKLNSSFLDKSIKSLPLLESD